MGNTITQSITYGTHMRTNPRAEKAIVFLEDRSNNTKPIPDDWLLEDELMWLQQYGRQACAKYMREKSQGGTIG